MKIKISPAFSLWMLLTIALVIFIGLSFSDDFRIGNHTLSKAYFPETLSPKKEALPKEDFQEMPDTMVSIPLAQPDTTVHSVLVFGDSMTHLLAMSISQYGTKNNYHLTSVTWESSSIPGWSNSDKIPKYIEESKPDFIIVSLGSNEMELKHFERRIPDVEKIVAAIGDIPFVWVGPPLWKEDKGVYEMLEKSLPKGVVFRVGEDVDIPRGKDKIHPTRKGAQIWADTLMRWIPLSPHPILAEKPDSGTSTRGHTFIYLHPDD